MGRPIMKKEEFDSIIKQLVQMKDKDALFIYKIVNIYGNEKYYDMYDQLARVSVDSVSVDYFDYIAFVYKHIRNKNRIVK